MKTGCAAALVLSSIVSVPAAAQPPAGTDQISDWRRVIRLKPGTEIVVELHGLPPASRYFLSADESELVVLNLSDAALPKEVTRTLREIAVKNPRFLDPDGRLNTTQGRVRVTANGVFLRDEMLAELTDVFDRIARPEVVTVATPLKKRGSRLGAVLGGTAGFLGGWFLARLPLRFVYSGNPLWVVAMVALPIAGAVLGYEAETRTTQRIIYRASGG